MRAAVLLLVLGGCDQLFDLNHLHEPDPESEIDAALGQIIDASLTCANGNFYGQYGEGGAGLMKVCVPATAPASISIVADIDTSSDSSCDLVLVVDSYGTEACVKWATDIMVDSVHATGGRALVLVASQHIVLNGLIDVGSHQGTSVRGAGANWGGCPANNGPDGALGGGGGAGGSFSKRAGNGGANAGGNYTAARPSVALDRVRGGCAGGNGGKGPGLGNGGGSGRAGGAVYLIAGMAIDLGPSAIINASGQGGHGGVSAGAAFSAGGGGGGGGGSGGLIGLDSPQVTVAPTATIFANGGGGGGGGALASNGGDGADPKVSAYATVAAGGLGPSLAGKGGSGAASSTNAGSGNGGKAGGGGGGAVGYVAIFTTGPPVTTGQFSPSITSVGQP